MWICMHSCEHPKPWTLSNLFTYCRLLWWLALWRRRRKRATRQQTIPGSDFRRQWCTRTLRGYCLVTKHFQLYERLEPCIHYKVVFIPIFRLFSEDYSSSETQKTYRVYFSSDNYFCAESMDKKSHLLEYKFQEPVARTI